MHADLLEVARTLADRGWLPGIQADKYGVRRLFATQQVTEADLHLAAHNEIMRRGWAYRVGAYTVIADDERKAFGTASELNRGNDTLALLRCLLAACEAQEAKP